MDERQTEQLLDDLLVEWELAREQHDFRSQDADPESRSQFEDSSDSVQLTSELCRDHPHLERPLRQRIAKLNASRWMLRDVTSGVGDAAGPGSTGSLRPITSLEDFVDAVRINDLLTTETLHRVGQLSANESVRSAEELADALVSDGVLTRYQVDVLLQGSSSPLVLDRYVIQDALGAGGMGVVYRAVHRSMQRVVAIKLLPGRLTDSPDKVERFRREVKSAARLQHPNVVAALDAHEQRDIHFLVMEYVDGDDLAELVGRQGTLDLKDAVDIIDQVASGLGAAHELGMVHRDVKPSNIMLANDGTAKLLDLGLAKSFDDAHEANDHDLTQDGVAIGTARYMSPEQAMDARSADHRSDLYSLGCTLYFLLHGHGPFDRATSVQTIVAHRESPPPLLTESEDDFSRRIQYAYERLLEKRPENRPRNVKQLRAMLAGEETSLVPATRIEPLDLSASGAEPHPSRSDQWGRTNRIAGVVAGCWHLPSWPMC